MKSRILTIAIILTSILIFIQLGSPIFATQHEVPPPPQVPEPECSAEVKNEVREETRQLTEYMTAHFQNNASTSRLLPDAIKRFKLYNTALLNILARLDTIVTGDQATQIGAIRTSCRKFVHDHLFATKEIFKMHVLANAQGKRATRLVDTYKEINDKLEKLNLQIAQMYGYFLTFSKKLPCYASECVK